MLIYSTNSGGPFGTTPTTMAATAGYKRVRRRKGFGIRAKVAERKQQRRSRRPRKVKTKGKKVKRTIRRKTTSRTKKKKKLYAKNVNFLKKLGLRVKKN